MQVIGLTCHVVRNCRAASRILAAKTPNIEAPRRRGGVARCRGAMAAGLTAEQAAKAAGIPRATLCRSLRAVMTASIPLRRGSASGAIISRCSCVSRISLPKSFARSWPANSPAS
jgi:hypothetical protein